jgi:hypothetical protein
VIIELSIPKSMSPTAMEQSLFSSWEATSFATSQKSSSFASFRPADNHD